MTGTRPFRPRFAFARIIIRIYLYIYYVVTGTVFQPPVTPHLCILLLLLLYRSPLTCANFARRFFRVSEQRSRRGQKKKTGRRTTDERARLEKKTDSHVLRYPSTTGEPLRDSDSDTERFSPCPEYPSTELETGTIQKTLRLNASRINRASSETLRSTKNIVSGSSRIRDGNREK